MWAPLSRLLSQRKAALVAGALAVPVAAELLYMQHRAQELSALLADDPQKPAFMRRAMHHLGRKLTNGVHLLVLGPTGVGKTRALQEVSRAVPASSSLLPFYVDLSRCVPSDATQLTPEELARRTSEAFAAEAKSFDLRLLRLLESDARSLFWLSFSDVLPGWLSSQSVAELKGLSLLQHESPASLYGLLLRLESVAALRASLLDSLQGPMGATNPLRPVLIIDEVHLLQSSALAGVRAELLRFVDRHVHANERAAVVIVLLSSDASAQDIVRKWGRFGRRLRALRMGDLHDEEVPAFLAYLADSLPEELQPAFRTLFASPAARASLRARFGGYVSDLIALRDHVKATGDASPAALLAVRDSSAVAALVAVPERALNVPGLTPHELVKVFKKIVRSNLSPRGAVPLHTLGVSLDAVHALRAANLIELRVNESVDGEDYAELSVLGTPPQPYVCAPCPLARESMAQVVRQLRPRSWRWI